MSPPGGYAPRRLTIHDSHCRLYGLCTAAPSLAGAGAPARPGDGAAVSVVVGQLEVVDLGGVPAEQLLTSLEGDVEIGEGFRDAS
jgi:hypothetical protein